MPMTIFEAVKSTVTPRMAAEHFGLHVSRNGMACCPFHDDRHPSMKFYDDHFHCFGCQATGDVIEFTSKSRCHAPARNASTAEFPADFGETEYFIGQRSRFAKVCIGFAVFITRIQGGFYEY